MIFLTRVTRALTEHRCRYAIVGGHAVALHGAVRGTVDIDIAIAWDQKNLAAAATALETVGLVSRLPIGAEEVFAFRDEYVANRNLVAWNFYNPTNPAEQVDVVIDYDLRRKRRHRVTVAGDPVYVLSRRDLIAMKRASGRPQDLEDAEALERLA